MGKRSFIKGVLVGSGVVIGLLLLLFFAMQYIYLYTENSNFKKLREKSKLNCDKMPLHCLVRDESIEAISKYAKSGKDLELKDNWGQTALFWAIYREKFHIANNLLALGANPNTKDENGMSVLYQTILREKYDIADVLLEHGADINMLSGNEYPETVLHFCVMKNRLECVQYLLEHGANKHLEDSFGYTVFDRVKTHKHISKEIGEILKK